MKNFLFIYALCIFTGLASYAQDQTNLNPQDEFTYESHSSDIGATETVALAGGEFTTTASNVMVTKSSNSSGIGLTPGALSVSETGAALYTVPIAVPPGINGVEPNIAVHYNSQAGNGIAGWGWNVSGLSVISRIPSTKYHDNLIDPVDFDSSDRFALDGQRLIVKSGTYGGNGTTYQTENFSNIKITSHGVSPYGASYGPAYFIVYYPDGSSARYGYTTNSRSRLDYAITYWENPNGLRISYFYSTGNDIGVNSIDRITYGSKGSATGINEIQFVYRTRKRVEVSYIGGHTFARKRILDDIKVVGNGTPFRRYNLEHSQTGQGFDRVSKITEYSGDGSQTKPGIAFDYPNSSANINHTPVTSNLGVVNIEQRNAAAVSLDLTGNGKMDFLVYPTATKDKFYLFKGNDYIPWIVDTQGRFERIFPSTFINHQGRIPEGQGLTVVQNTTNNRVNFKMYVNGLSSALGLNYTKTWSAPIYTHQSSCGSSSTQRVPLKYLSGDFNGDGLTDVIGVGGSYSYTRCTPVNCDNDGGGDGDPTPVIQRVGIIPIEGDCCNCTTISQNFPQVYFVNLDRRLTTGFSSYSGQLLKTVGAKDRLETADVNGDGRMDILHFSPGKVTVYHLDSSNRLQRLWEVSSSKIKDDYPMLLGDYNGDGKMDIITPNAVGSKTYNYFISTGTGFLQKSYDNAFTFYLSNFNQDGGLQSGYNLLPVDLNGDGRTDIIQYDTKTYNTGTGEQVVKAHYNRYVDTSDLIPRFAYGGQKTVSGNVRHFPVPIYLSSDRPNKGLEFATISDRYISSFSFTLDHRGDMSLSTVSSNGISHSISYNALDQSDNANGPVYQMAMDQVYPYVDIASAPSVKLVRKIERRWSSGDTPNQIKSFFYKGAISHMEGLGFQGFQYTSQSNWHTSGADRIYTNITRDPQLRGAIIDQYTTPYTQRFGVIPSDYIEKTHLNYQHTLAANKVFTLKNVNTVTNNRIEGTFTARSYTYDAYNNVTGEEVNYNHQGWEFTGTTYANSTGSTYYIGRPTKIETNSSNATQQFGTEQRYTYTGYNLTQVQSRGHNTEFDVESYTYDTYGNVLTTTVTPYGETGRTVRYKYDASGRFVTETTDPEGLVTKYDYDSSTGMVIKETDPYNRVTNYEYSKLERLIKETDYLGNFTSYDYSRSSGFLTITASSNDGSGSVIKYDPLSRKQFERTKTLGGQWSQISYQYDGLDRVSAVSEPHFGSSATLWNTIEYDFYGRIIRQNNASGQVVNYSYSGLTVSVDDGTKVVSTTKNALGNVTKVVDPGGTITYAYHGNGGLLSSTYEGLSQTISQDGWGRKTRLVDPSGGVYTYEYNGWDEITKETTPKGQTEYTYDTFGKITRTKVTGDLTNMTTNYSYDNTTKLLNSISATDIINSRSYTYNYKYDSYKRPYRIEENTGTATFVRTTSFDAFGRVNRESYSAKTGNLSSNAAVDVNYDNYGAFKGYNNWEIGQQNARGQLTSINLGTGEIIRNTYNDFGFITKTTVTDPELNDPHIENSYSFDVKRGNLLSRTHRTTISGYNKSLKSDFFYDNQDRLYNIKSDNPRNLKYDAYGRTSNNSDIGAFTFNSGSGRYKIKDITLNSLGEKVFQNRRSQTITYNAFKKPVEVIETGGRVSFEYGPMLNRVRAWYGGVAADKTQRFYHKQYSSIFPGEIIEENTRDKRTKFIFYLGGDGYTAPMTQVETFANGSSGGAKLYHLQRDYLGSILNITEQKGNGADTFGLLVERREFGAWGTVDHFWSRTGATEMGHNSILDRGYTGHEHFFEVDLIHMNGRMYDPELGRFLSPDNYIQDPFNTQNYNRYSYVLNNPLKYADPSGEQYESGETPTVPIFISAAIMASSGIAHYWDKWGIKDWWNNSFGAWQPGRDIKNFFNDLFGGDKPKIITQSHNYASADPLMAPSPEISPIMNSSGGISDWQPLTKPILRDYIKNNYCTNCSSGRLENMTGNRFEQAWNNAALTDAELIANSYRPNRPNDKFPGNYQGKTRNVAPDGIGNTYLKAGNKAITFPDAAWYEVKAKNGYLYDSTNNGQIKGFITALAASDRVAQRQHQLALHFVTTSDLSVSFGTILSARWNHVVIKHHIARYRMINGRMQVQFGVKSRLYGPMIVHWSDSSTFL